uniref:Peptidase S1 domain-containing protein n=1 Tax=Strigamia maritima TaxID=126957 RepID=T1J4F9_STRMM
MICAGYNEGGTRDTCNGDSGGALMLPADRSNSKWVVEGIISGGEFTKCAQAEEYSIYVHTSFRISSLRKLSNSPEVNSPPLSVRIALILWPLSLSTLTWNFFVQQQASTKFMGSNASKEGHQTNDGSFGHSGPELFQTHNATTSISNEDSRPRKETTQLQQKSNNNNNYISKKAPAKNKETTLESNMHFIVDTFESVEKMTSKEKSKRRRCRRNKDKEKEKEKEDTKSKPTESTSAPTRLTKSPKQESESDNTEAKGILAKGKQFLLRRQPAIKHPKTAPSTSKTASSEKEESEDEWEYEKVVIDGFDPEKFKQANAAKKPNFTSNSCDDQTLLSVRPNGEPLVLRIRCAEIQERAVPSTLDFTDEQLISSIEKEFK